MLSFLIRRIGSGVLLVVAIAILGFLLLYAGAGDIARQILGDEASNQTVQQKSHELGLDRPLVTQFWDWFSHAFGGDLGNSWFTNQPVSDAIASRLAVTLSLVIGATVVVAIVSVSLGLLAATKRGWIDRVVQFLSLLGGAIPGFLVALGLVLVFAISLRIFRPTGYVPLGDSAVGWLSSVTLPIIALSFAGIASVTQQVRGATVDALRQDYVRTLRSRGLSNRRILFKHVLRNAAGPGLSVLAVNFVGMIGGAVVIEQVFAIPGLGQVAVIATQQGDIPLVMGLIIATALIVTVLNLLVNLLQGWLNPKVRLA